MRESKRFFGAAIVVSALSFLAVPGFAAGNSSSSDDTISKIMPFVLVGIVAVAAVAVVAMRASAGKKKSKKTESKPDVGPDVRQNIGAVPNGEPEPAVTTEPEIKDDTPNLEVETAEQAPDPEPEIKDASTVEVETTEQDAPAGPEIMYEAPVKLESVEVVPEPEQQIIEISTVDVEENEPVPETEPEIKDETVVEVETEGSEPEVREEPAAEVGSVESPVETETEETVVDVEAEDVTPESEVKNEAAAELKAEETVAGSEPEVKDEALSEIADQADSEEKSDDTELKPGEFRDPETGCIYTYNSAGLPVPPDGMVIRYKWSFLGRLIQADDTLKYRYMTIRRLLLSYKKVRSNVSWNFDSYFLGRKPIAKVKVRGKQLVVYFNIDPASMVGTKYIGEDASKITRYKAVPFAYRVNGERKLQYTMELIRKLMEDTPCTEPDYIQPAQAKYAIPYEDLSELYNRGYVKIGGFLAVSRDGQKVTDDDDDEPVSEADNEEEDVQVAEVQEDVTPVEKEDFGFNPSKK